MESKTHTTTQNIIWNALGTVFYFACQWLLTIYAVHFSGGYADAGILSLAMSISGPLQIVASLNLRTFQVSELDNRFSDGDFLINRILMSAVSLLLCICTVIYGGYSKYESVCMIIFMVFRISEALADVLHGIDQKAWRLDIAGKSFILRGCAILLAIIGGTLLGKSLSVTILVMTGLVCLIIYFYDYRACQKQACPNFSYKRNNIVDLTRTGIPLALYSIFLTLVSYYPRFQIEKLYGKEILGIFSSITTPTVLVTQLANFIFSPLMGIFAECRKEHDKKRLYRLLSVSFGGTILIGVLAITAGNVLGEWALVLLFGESIRQYAYLLIPIIYTAILTAIIWLLCGLLTVFKDYYALAVLTCVSLSLCLISAPFLISERQLMGAVLTLTMALAAETILLVIRFLYRLKIEHLFL